MHNNKIVTMISNMTLTIKNAVQYNTARR